VFSEPEKLSCPGIYNYNLWNRGSERRTYMGNLVILQMKMEANKYPLTRRDRTKYFAKSVIISRHNIRIEMTVQTLRVLMMMKIIIIIPIKFIN
jgi:hypothetical protein